MNINRKLVAIAAAVVALAAGGVGIAYAVGGGESTFPLPQCAERMKIGISDQSLEPPWDLARHGADVILHRPRSMQKRGVYFAGGGTIPPPTNTPLAEVIQHGSAHQELKLLT